MLRTGAPPPPNPNSKQLPPTSPSSQGNVVIDLKLWKHSTERGSGARAGARPGRTGSAAEGQGPGPAAVTRRGGTKSGESGACPASWHVSATCLGGSCPCVSSGLRLSLTLDRADLLRSARRRFSSGLSALLVSEFLEHHCYSPRKDAHCTHPHQRQALLDLTQQDRTTEAWSTGRLRHEARVNHLILTSATTSSLLFQHQLVARYSSGKGTHCALFFYVRSQPGSHTSRKHSQPQSTPLRHRHSLQALSTRHHWKFVKPSTAPVPKSPGRSSEPTTKQNQCDNE
ncbi:uncharacterized protein LOC107516921 [Rousettus aegyptiacus]|uniref:uncharacterized protein LOC107516921 n=1 Tax=Rousettus aegyptiacus TaxID=9407 RepID=UPI00168D8BA8|nr:uncharacterized protein LOC107516921 [Rousettus aegyptiacus]